VTVEGDQQQLLLIVPALISATAWQLSVELAAATEA
jgi:hypothetical protein